MIKTAAISSFPIRINFNKSRGNFLYDDETDREYLDFFGMYSSLPLGYNHPHLLTKEFQQEILEVSQFRVCNCRIDSKQKKEFLDSFVEFAVPKEFSAIHFSCTGGLAVEHACKTAMFHTKKNKLILGEDAEYLSIVSFKNGFHGITSFGNFTTSKTGIPGDRLSGFPDLYWPRVSTSLDLRELFKADQWNDIAGVIIEPIQCTFGDVHISIDELNQIRNITEEHGVPLIFDEVQTGFCATGHKWFFNKLSWVPDIVVFGKKSQVCGIMVKRGFDSIFENPEAGRLCITFDGDLTDMVRCKHIIKAITDLGLIENVNQRSEQFISALVNEPKIKNLRSAGVIIGFDLKNKEIRDTFVNNLYKIGMIVNSTGEKSVRLRPSLSVSSSEISLAIRLIKEALNEN